MGKPRHTRSVDANHYGIVEHLRLNRIEVHDMSAIGRFTDILTYRLGQARWAEIKVDDRAAVDFKRPTLEFMALTGMDVAFVSSPEQALAFAERGTGRLTGVQQERLLGLLIRNPDKKKFTARQVEEALGGGFTFGSRMS